MFLSFHTTDSSSVEGTDSSGRIHGFDSTSWVLSTEEVFTGLAQQPCGGLP